MAVCTTLWTAWVSLAVASLLVILAQVDPFRLLYRLAVVNIFIVFLWFFLPFSTTGDTVFTIGPLEATKQGINAAMLLTFKSNAIVTSLVALIGTIPIQDLGPAMQKVGIPSKLCHLLLYTFRYIFVIRQEYETMSRAMTVRGFQPRNNTHTYRTYAWLVGMLLVRSWDRAERVNHAMLCRGFTGRLYSMTSFHMNVSGIVLMISAAATGISLAVLDLLHKGIL